MVEGRTPAADIKVSILGPVEISGAARPFRRTGALDLVVYLALHPGGAANDVWATALWPDKLLAAPTLHSIVSAARRSLGRSPAGMDHLPHAHGRLALNSDVTSDWGRFQELACSDRQESREQALELVRGSPFLGLRYSDWTVLEGFRSDIEEAVGRTAHDVATAALERRCPEAARVAARRGLRAAPYDERLYRILMLAADLDGNPAGVVSAMRELIGVLGPELGRPARLSAWNEMAEFVHPETNRLYRRLSRGFADLEPGNCPKCPSVPATGGRVATL